MTGVYTFTALAVIAMAVAWFGARRSHQSVSTRRPVSDDATPPVVLGGDYCDGDSGGDSGGGCD